MKNRVLLLIIGLLYFVFYSYAAPTSPISVSAKAGNMTELIIGAVSGSDASWQGFYGNISGSVTLDNGAGGTLYKWGGVTTAAGEVYATNETISDWAGVICMNLSASHPGYNCTGQNEECLNITELETFYSIGSGDADGIDETFNQTIVNITVGTTTLENCPMTSLYVNETVDPKKSWNETLLTINDSTSIIYASIINDDAMGFNNVTWDFQMIVGENSEDENPMTYYLYTELA